LCDITHNSLPIIKRKATQRRALVVTRWPEPVRGWEFIAPIHERAVHAAGSGSCAGD